MAASKSLAGTLIVLTLLIATPAKAVINITSDEIWDGLNNPHAADGVTLSVTGSHATNNWVATYTIPDELVIAAGANIFIHDLNVTNATQAMVWNFTGTGGNKGLTFGDALSTIDLTKGGRNLNPNGTSLTMNMNDNPVGGLVPGAGRMINGIFVLAGQTNDSLGVVINAGTAPVKVGLIDVSRNDAFTGPVTITSRGLIDVDEIGTADINTGGGSATNVSLTGTSIVLGNVNGFQNRTSGGSQATVNLRALGQPANNTGDFNANTLAQNTITLDGLIKTNGTGPAGSSTGGNLIVSTVSLTLASTFALDLNENATFTANVGALNPGNTAGQMFINNSSVTPTTVNNQVFHDGLGPAAVSWAANNSGNWATGANWTLGAAPNSSVTVGTFGSVITSPQTVFLNTGAIAKGIVFDTTSKVAVGGPAILTLEALSGNASISVLQGSHEVQTQITLQSNTDASAATGTSVALNGVLNLNGKTLNVSGAGQVNINNSVTGLGSIVNGGSLGTGGATGLAGDLSSTGMLAIDIGGAVTNSFDSWAITGNATLSGVLAVDTIGGFTPSSGQSFTVLTAANVSATSLTLGGPDAGLFTLIKNPTSLVLQALSAGIPGDYNGNGVVDTADYVVWRNGGSPDSSQAGYNLWRSRFGNTSGSGSNVGSAAGAVPEPASALIAGLAGLAMTIAGRRRS
jgi:hypothetical protein